MWHNTKQTRAKQSRTMKMKYDAVFNERIAQIERFISMHEIRRLAHENDYSYSMIRDMILRDYPDIICAQNPSVFTALLKRCDVTYDHTKYLKKPTWWRSQFKFGINVTYEELEHIFYEKSRRGQRTLLQQRLGWKNYAPQYSVEYWMERLSVGYDDALRALEKFKNSISPRRIEFYLSRGVDEEKAREKISSDAVLGAISTLKKCAGAKSTSGRVKSLLEELGLEFQHEFHVKLEKNECVYRKRAYVYDFLIPSKNLLIECHGTYWHADPRVFESDSIHGGGAPNGAGAYARCVGPRGAARPHAPEHGVHGFPGFYIFQISRVLHLIFGALMNTNEALQ